MNRFDILRRRLVNQLLVASNAETPGDVVRHLGAVQAQDYSGGEWSIGLRLPGSKLADVEKDISEGKIVRTWALRGTLHFIAGEDTRWVLELLAPGIKAGLARRYKELGLDQATFKKTNSILAKALKGNKHLTRGELKAIIEKKSISCEGQRMTFILHRASLDRVICFGVTRGKQQTHALFDEMVPSVEPKDHEESLSELAHRYFKSHGPATIQDYMWWSGLSAADAKAGLEMANSELEQVTIEGMAYWMSRDASPEKSKAPVVRLLPMFDDFLLGYKDRSASIEPAVLRQLRTGGMPDPTIIIDGRVVGKWSRTFKKDGVFVELKRFRTFRSLEEKTLANAVSRYKMFIGKKTG
jgi:DNA glycosylase AlkZ-like